MKHYTYKSYKLCSNEIWEGIGPLKPLPWISLYNKNTVQQKVIEKKKKKKHYILVETLFSQYFKICPSLNKTGYASWEVIVIKTTACKQWKVRFK